MSEVNKSIVRRFVDEVINRGDLGAVDELLLEGFVDHQPLLEGLPQGRGGVKQQFALLHAAFSGLHLELEQVVAEGDQVAFRGVLHGTHSGQLESLAPTQQALALEMYSILRLAKGRITEHWSALKHQDLLQALRPHSYPV